MRKLWWWILLASFPVLAEPDGGPALSTRARKRAGLYGTILGDPAPSLIGANAAYNVTQHVRLHGGVGYIPLFLDSATTWGFGLQYLFLGDRPFSPYVGASVGFTRARLERLGRLFDILFDEAPPEVPEETFTAYSVTFGVDWQFAPGVNVGFALKGVILADTPGLVPIPGAHLGWYF